MNLKTTLPYFTLLLSFLPTTYCHFPRPLSVYLDVGGTLPNAEVDDTEFIDVVVTNDVGGFVTCGAYKDVAGQQRFEPASVGQMKKTAFRTGREDCVPDQLCAVRLRGMVTGQRYYVYCVGNPVVEGFGKSKVTYAGFFQTGGYQLSSLTLSETKPTYFTVEAMVTQTSDVYCVAIESGLDLSVSYDIIFTGKKNGDTITSGHRSCIKETSCSVSLGNAIPQKEYNVRCAGRVRPPVGTDPTIPDLPWLFTPITSMAQRPQTEPITFLDTPTEFRAAPTFIKLKTKINLTGTVICGAFPQSDTINTVSIARFGDDDVYANHQVCLNTRVCYVTLSALPPANPFDVYCFATTKDGKARSPITTKIVSATTSILFTPAISPLSQEGSSEAHAVTVRMTMNVGVNGWCAAYAPGSQATSSPDKDAILGATLKAFAFCRRGNPCLVRIEGLQESTIYDVYCVTFTTVSDGEQPMVSDTVGPLTIVSGVAGQNGGGDLFDNIFGSFNKEKRMAVLRGDHNRNIKLNNNKFAIAQQDTQTEQQEIGKDKQELTKQTEHKEQIVKHHTTHSGTQTELEVKPLQQVDNNVVTEMSSNKSKLREESVQAVQEDLGPHGELGKKLRLDDSNIVLSGNGYMMAALSVAMFALGMLVAGRRSQHTHYHLVKSV